MQFTDFARAHGVEILNLDTSGRIKRCGTSAHPRSDNGAYLFDGRRGWCMAWDLDGEVHWFADDSAKPWTDEEKRALARQQEERRKRILAGHQRAAQRAQEMIDAAKLGPSRYLAFKGFRERLQRGRQPDERHGYGLILDDALIVPMRSLTGQLQGAQVIKWNPETREHEKKMLPGMKAKGAVFRLGAPRARTTILCEGYATAVSIKLATEQMRLSMAVLACFSDSNLVYIAPHVTGERIVFADNDKSGAGEKAAKATGLAYCMAPDIGDDANDVHVKQGLFAVCGLMQRARTS